MRVFGLLLTFQGAFFIDCVMSRFSYVTLHYHLTSKIYYVHVPVLVRKIRLSQKS